MLNRFAIALHWLGFLVSVFFILAIVNNLYSDDVLVVGIFAPFVSTWIIRFILTGNKKLLPTEY
jgi:hypothetical protein